MTPIFPRTSFQKFYDGFHLGLELVVNCKHMMRVYFWIEDILHLKRSGSLCPWCFMFCYIQFCDEMNSLHYTVSLQIKFLKLNSKSQIYLTYQGMGEATTIQEKAFFLLYTLIARDARTIKLQPSRCSGFSDWISVYRCKTSRH